MSESSSLRYGVELQNRKKIDGKIEYGPREVATILKLYTALESNYTFFDKTLRNTSQKYMLLLKIH